MGWHIYNYGTINMAVLLADTLEGLSPTGLEEAPV